ncbi:MAG: GH116 family glycosyl-hydrolase, partial [Cyanobacteria bacterium J06638_20]
MAASSSQIPPYTWQHPIGQGWEHHYIVRYASNLDDGPWHGAPLGGFGAGCIGRSPRGDFNLWHLDGGEHVFQTFPACQFSVFEQSGETRQAYGLSTEALQDGTLGGWQWYPASKEEREVGVRGQELTAEGRRHKAEGRRQKAEGRRQKAEGRRQKAEVSNQELGARSQEPGAEFRFPNSEFRVHPSTQTGTYHALYPRSWYIYENVFKAELTCEQFSPIWAQNYQEASYPVAVFLWTAHNPTDEPLTLSILLSWQNMVGWFTNTAPSPEVLQRDDGSPYYDYVPAIGQSMGSRNHFVQVGDVMGCVMDGAWSQTGQLPQEGEGQWAIATQIQPNTEIFYNTRWNPAGDGQDLWKTFAVDGSLVNSALDTPANEGEQLGCAIAVRLTLQPGETCEIPMTLAWDLPVTEYAAGISECRRYTDFFGREGCHAWAIAKTALAHYETWRQQIIDWQQPILDQPDLPTWFKMALFNELYDLTSGGTLWTAATDKDPVGQFAVLECIDYRWYESLDVRLYGGFATLILWPELEKAVIRAFARAIPAADDRTRIIGYYYTVGEENHFAPRKLKGATPHDLGAPNEHPFVQTNYTSYQDCNQWKDLPSDFVIQVYRAYKLTGETDVDFLAECWPAVTETLKYLKRFDTDSDGIPENGGAPDQTFDDWQLKGVSAYCGGLWMAALASAIAIAQVLTAADRAPGNTPILITQYERWLAQSRNVYHKRLWNGRYYRLETGSDSEVVMADQLCGQFCTQLLGLPDLVEAKYVRSALDAVYDACFVKFNDYAAQNAKPQEQKFIGSQTGTFRSVQSGVAIGAANGVLPDGSPEDPDGTHQLEVWTGINFG